MIQVDLPIDWGIIIICPQCFDVWGRVAGVNPIYWHRYVPCEGHEGAAYGSSIPGGLLDAEASLLDLLPDDLLKREFNLTLQASTRNPNDGAQQ